MNKLLIIPLLMFSFISQAQIADRITFSYDDAGNQIQRKLCINCTTSKTSNSIPKEISELKEEDLQKFSPEDVISYYPNPVKEELYLKWELVNNNAVTSIQVYGLNGQLVSSHAQLEKKNTQNISFQSYPRGVYAVILFYTNGEQKPIKIIKK